MNHTQRIAYACSIASNLEEPKRAKDVHRYHQAIVDALNEIHDGNNEQDVLAVMEGFAHAIAQMLAAMDDFDARRGYLEFIVRRAEWLFDAYRGTDAAARHRMVER